MTIYFVSNVTGFKKFFPRVIIQAVEIKKKGNIKFDVGYPVNFIIGTRLRNGIRSTRDEKREGRSFEVNNKKKKNKCSKREDDDDHMKGSARIRDWSSLIPCYKT